MLFNSFQYWIFFLIVVTLFYSVPFRIGKVLTPGCELHLLHVVGSTIHRVDSYLYGS